MCPRFLTRRRFLLDAGATGLTGAVMLSGLIPLAGCGNGQESDQSTPAAGAKQAAADPCSDRSGLTEAQIETREMYAYVDRSEVDGEFCDNCEFWEPAPEGKTCGGCTLMEGPIHPKGWCEAWSESA